MKSIRCRREWRHEHVRMSVGCGAAHHERSENGVWGHPQEAPAFSGGSPQTPVSSLRSSRTWAAHYERSENGGLGGNPGGIGTTCVAIVVPMTDFNASLNAVQQMT